tara:strand:+ start:189 stop:611 length:423 start_codon:yes stop_codon:yes gene_type:complete
MAFLQNILIEDVDNVAEGIGLLLPFTIDGDNVSTSTLTSVKTNLTNLLLTEKGERVFQPNLGVELRKHLFNNITTESVVGLEEDILEQIAIWLPFLKVENIKTNQLPAENLLKVEILYSFKSNSQLTDSVQVDLSTGASY